MDGAIELFELLLSGFNIIQLNRIMSVHERLLRGKLANDVDRAQDGAHGKGLKNDLEWAESSYVEACIDNHTLAGGPVNDSKFASPFRRTNAIRGNIARVGRWKRQ